MYVERLHAVALAIDVTTRLLSTLDSCARGIAAEVETWPSTNDVSLTPRTRRRLEAVVRRGTDEGGSG